MPPQTRASMISLSAARSGRSAAAAPGKRLESMSNATLSVPKNSWQCEHGAAHAPVTGRVVRERRRGERRARRRRRVEQRLPVRVGLRLRVPVGVCLADRRHRTPEVPVVLVVPAGDRAVSGGEVDHREEPGLSAVSRPCSAERSRDSAVPERHGRGLPEDGRGRLVRGPRRALQRTELLDLVEVLRVGGARQRVGPSERNCDGLSMRNGSSRRPTRPGRARWVSPAASRPDRCRYELNGARNPSSCAGGDHRRGRGLTGGDSFVLAWPVRMPASVAS